jgi:hypothetical protein
MDSFIVILFLAKFCLIENLILTYSKDLDSPDFEKKIRNHHAFNKGSKFGSFTNLKKQPQEKKTWLTGLFEILDEIKPTKASSEQATKERKSNKSIVFLPPPPPQKKKMIKNR